MIVFLYQLGALIWVWTAWYLLVRAECDHESDLTGKVPLKPVEWLMRDIKRVWYPELRPPDWHFGHSLMILWVFLTGPLIACCFPYMFNLK